MAIENLSFYWDRFSRLKNNNNPTPYRGMEIMEGVADDGAVLQAVFVGPHTSRGRKQQKSQAIPLASDKDRQPMIVRDKVVSGNIVDGADSLEIVRATDNNKSFRIFRTGLIQEQGGIQRDLLRLRAGDQKLRWHGAFALEVGSAHQIAEGTSVEVTEMAKMLTDDGSGRIRGMKGVPQIRDRCFMIPEGGAVICGDIGRELTIHERKRGKTLIWDVTNDPAMQKLFEQLMGAEAEQQKLAAAG